MLDDEKFSLLDRIGRQAVAFFFRYDSLSVDVCFVNKLDLSLWKSCWLCAEKKNINRKIGKLSDASMLPLLVALVELSCLRMAMGALKTFDFNEGSSNKSINSNFSRNVFQTCKKDALATPNTINLSSCINRGMSERRNLHKTYESVRTCAAFWVYVYNFQLKCTLSCARCNCVLTTRIINGCWIIDNAAGINLLTFLWLRTTW